MFEIVASYHCMQFQGKSVIQNQENYEKPHLGPDLGTLDPNLGRQIFCLKICLRQSLDIMVSYHHAEYQKKLMIQS